MKEEEEEREGKKRVRKKAKLVPIFSKRKRSQNCVKEMDSYEK